MAGEVMKMTRVIVAPHVAYRDGYQSRALGLPYKVPEKYDFCLKHWWYAGYNDLDMELKEKAAKLGKVYHK